MKKRSRCFTPLIYMAALTAMILLSAPQTIRAAGGRTTVQSGWQLISVPYSITEENACAGPGGGEVFGIRDNSYRTCAGLESSWAPGRGFWVYSENEAEFSVEGAPLPAAGSYSISLEKGWNIIGTPYLFTVSVTDALLVDGVSFRESDKVEHGIYGYDSEIGDYVEVNELEPWKGYLVKALAEAELEIKAIDADNAAARTHTLRVVDAPGSGGEEIGSLDLEPGDTVDLWAAAYDRAGAFIDNVSAAWSVNGDLPPIITALADHISVTVTEENAGGKFTAAFQDMIDSTGDFTVIGNGELFAYPFDGETTTFTDPETGLEYISSQLLAAVKNGIESARAMEIIESLGGKIIGRNVPAGVYQIKAPQGLPAEDFIDTLENNENILFASLHYILSADGYPDDPVFDPASPPGHKWAYERIGMPAAWDMLAPVGEPVIAVIDTGVDTTHPDLASKLLPGRNFVDPAAPDDVTDESGHGTAVAGIAAAGADNGTGIAGICHTCSIMPLKACAAGGSCPVFNVANAITYAADNGADIINLSVGAKLTPGSSAANILETVVRAAAAAGPLIVAAAGNGDSDMIDFYPARVRNVFSVAATDENDARAAFSNYGAGVDIAAPGVNIYTTAPGGYGFYDGTSMAAAYVSGAAGLLMSVQEGLDARYVQDTIKFSADIITTDRPISGRLNVETLLSHFLTYNKPPHISSVDPAQRSAAGGTTIAVTVAAADPDADVLSYEWSATGGAISSGGDTAEWTLPDQRGSYKVTVTVTDSLGQSAEASAHVVVLDGPLEQLRITPMNAIIEMGETMQYRVFCLDHDAIYNGTAPVECHADEWDISAALGSIDENGMFAATAEGSGRIYAAVGPLEYDVRVITTYAGGANLYTVADSTPCAGTWGPRCNPAGTNVTTLSLIPPLTQRARYNPPGSEAFRDQPIAYNKVLYIGDTKGSVHAIDHETMTAVWPPLDLSGANAQFSGSMAFDPGFNNIYGASLNGYVYKISISGPAKGTKIWEYSPLPGPPGDYKFNSNVVVDGTDIYVGSQFDRGFVKGRIYKLTDNGGTVTEEWRYPNTPVSNIGRFSGPLGLDTFGGTKMITGGTLEGVFYAVDTAGNLVCEYDTGSTIAGGPVLVNGFAYIGSDDGRFHKIDPSNVTGQDCAAAWDPPVMLEQIRAAAAYKNNVFYIPTNTGKIYAVRETGPGPTDYSIDWDSGMTGTYNEAPVIYAGAAGNPAGVLVTTNSKATAYDLTNGDVIGIESALLAGSGNNSIILELPSGEIEAYVSTLTLGVLALERNFPPVIVDYFLQEMPVDGVAMPPDGTSASATVFVDDPNGLDDIDNVTADLTPIGGPSAVDLNPAGPEKYRNFSDLDVVAGTMPGTYNIGVTVTDKGGLTTTTTRTLDVANLPPTAANMNFAPASICNDGSTASTLTLEVSDPNSLDHIDTVQAQLQPIKGVSTIIDLFDDGSNGDATADDGVYTNDAVTAALAVGLGNFTIFATATDLAGESASDSDSIQVEDCSPPTDIANVYDGPDMGIDLDTATSTTKLSCNWTASSDPQSAIDSYWYAIGDTPGDTNVLGWTDNGLNLSVTNSSLALTDGVTYYCSVKARNTAGLESIPTDSDGQIIDASPPVQSNWNPGNGADICSTSPSVTLDTDENATCRWSLSDDGYSAMPGANVCGGAGTQGHTCAVSGLAHGSNNIYIACIDDQLNEHTAANNTQLTYDVDIQPPAQQSWDPAKSDWLTTTGFSIEIGTDENATCRWSLADDSYAAIPGANTCGGSGTAVQDCSVTGLSEGLDFVFVSCTDACGNEDTAATNEDIDYNIDTTPPTDPDPVNDGTGADIDVTASLTTLSCNWAVSSDGGSGLSNYWYSIGTTSGASDTVGWTSTNNTTVTETGLALVANTTYYCSVQAEDDLGHVSGKVTSDGQKVVPAQPPTVANVQFTPAVLCADGSTVATVTADVSDPNGPGDIDHVRIQTQPINNGAPLELDLYDDGTNGDAAAGDGEYTNDSISVTPGTALGIKTLVVTATDLNATTGADSNTVDIQDCTPPTDIATVNDGTGADISFTNSPTDLSCNWTASSDPESGVARYLYSFGTSAGATDTVDWTDNAAAITVTHTGLALTNGVTYYCNVKAENGAGMESNVTSSNGQLVDFTPPVQSNWNPASASSLCGSSASIDLETDEPAVCAWSFADQAFSAMTNICTIVSPTEHTCDVTGLVSGPQQAHIACSDVYGNEHDSTTNTDLDYTVDALAPVMSNWNPVKSTTLTSTSETVVFKTDEDADCAWSLTDQAYSAMAGVCATTGAKDHTCDVAGMQEGAEIVYFACRDTSCGNEQTAADNEHVDYIIDTTPPVQSNWNPAKGAIITATSQDIELDTDEIGICRWSLSDQAYGAMANTCNGAGTDSHTCQATGLQPGAEIVYIACQDTHLNADTVLTNEEVDYIVDTSPPADITPNDGDTAGVDIDTQGDASLLSCNWPASADPETGIDHYEYSLGDAPGDTNIAGWTSVNNTTTLITKTGLSLTIGDTYYCNVKAVNGAGMESNMQSSDGVTVADIAPVPPVLSASGGIHQVTLDWQAPTKTINGTPLDPATLVYEIYRSTTQGGPYAGPPLHTTAAGVTSYVDAAPSVVDWTTYYYIVIAVMTGPGLESDPSNEDDATPTDVPYTFKQTCGERDYTVYHPSDYYAEGIAYMNSPYGITSDDTYVFVADTENHRVSAFRQSDCYFMSPPWGEYGYTDGKFLKPNGIVYDSGKVYVVDFSDRLHVYDASGPASGTFEISHNVIAPYKVSLSGDGSLYVSTFNDMIYKIDPSTGDIDMSASFAAPGSRGVVYNPVDNKIYVTDWEDDIIRIFDPATGDETGTIGSQGGGYGQFNDPLGITVDTAGNIYVADSGNNRIQVFDTAGDIVNVITSGSSPAQRIRNPRGVTVSPTTGNVWVTDAGNHRIIEFDKP